MIREKIALYGGKITSIDTPLTVPQIINKILTSMIVPLAAAIAVGAILYAGVLYMTSQGDPEKLAKAKKALLYAIVGILLVVFSWAIVITLSGGYLNKFFGS